MYNYRFILQFVIAICFAATVSAQELRQKHIVFDETMGLTDKVIIDIAEDSTGLIWLISENNLYWFDGSSFNKIQHGNGIHQIPGNVFSQLYQSPENEIWIIYHKGYSIYNPTTHSFQHFKDIIPGNENEHYTMAAQKDKELIFSSGKNSFYVNRITRKISGFSQNDDILLYQFPPVFHNGYLIKYQNKNLQFSFFNQKASFLIPVEYPTENFNVQLLNDSLVLLANDQTVDIYNSIDGKKIRSINYPSAKKLNAYRKPVKIIQKNRWEVLFLLDDELWIFNLRSLQFTSNIISLSGKNFISNGYFKNAFFDKLGNLWVSTNLNGVMKISFRTQPLQLIGKDGDNNNFIKCFNVNKSANVILAGTYGNGLVLYDTSGNLLKNFPLQKTGKDGGSIITTIGQLDDFNYLVFAFADTIQYIVNIKEYTVRNIHVPEFQGIGYYQELIQLIPGELLYAFSDLNTTKIKWLNGELNTSIANQEDKRRLELMGNISVQHHNLDAITGNPYFSKCIKQLALGQAGRLILQRRNDHWFIGTIKGVFEFNKKAELINSYNIESGIADEYIYAIVLDNNGDIWCSHNKGISRISKEGNILNLSKEDGLQADEFNYGAAAKTTDGQLFFGGVKGLNSFYPSLINNQLETPELLVTHISTTDNKLPTDTAFWNINNIELPFAKNSIKILVSALGNFEGNYYNYQYRVKGLFSEWKNLGHNREINLALQSGSYVLEIAAGNSFMKNAIPQKFIKIKIIPPLYQRWWFIAMLVVLAILIIILVMQNLNRQRYQKKLTTLKMQQQVENERRRISRDLHDNMGAYTTALLSNVEKLKHKTNNSDDLEKMASNAQNILNSLRETIWVLNNKEISVSDFCDAFKSYCIKILQNFEDVNFESEENILNNKKLPAGEAIHFDKILKEAFQNIIKHSAANEIIFKVESNDHFLCFSIEDNGKGFELNDIERGNGLNNMQWRAKEAGAVLTIAKNRNNTGSIIFLKK